LCSCLSVRYYQPYFDVDTEHVKDRILYAIFPFNKESTFIQVRFLPPSLPPSPLSNPSVALFLGVLHEKHSHAKLPSTMPIPTSPSLPPSLPQLLGPNPDAYGPFWVATTLVFVIAVVSNLSSYFLFDEEEGSKW